MWDRFKASILSISKRTKNINTLKHKKNVSASGERVICILISTLCYRVPLGVIIMSFEKISLWKIQLIFPHTYFAHSPTSSPIFKIEGRNHKKTPFLLAQDSNRGKLCPTTYPPEWRDLWKPKCDSLSIKPRVQCLKWTDQAATQNPHFCHLQKKLV